MTTISRIEADYAKTYALGLYRGARACLNPFDAARKERNASAIYLADRVLAGDDLLYAAELYRAAQAICDEVDRRADVGGERKFRELTTREQYWLLGKLAATR